MYEASKAVKRKGKRTAGSKEAYKSTVMIRKRGQNKRTENLTQLLQREAEEESEQRQGV